MRGGGVVPCDPLHTAERTAAVVPLVAPYCAIPRDYLSDTPLLCAMGFLVSQHGQLGAIPPPPFLSVSPLESMRSGGAIPPPQKGYLSDTCAIPYENKAKGCDSPLCDTISKGYCAIWGGISLWAAKVVPKGPFRTKNAITMESAVLCYRRSILLSMPIRCAFSKDKKHTNYHPQEKIQDEQKNVFCIYFRLNFMYCVT